MKIAVWYHCKISGRGIPMPDAAIGIAAEQMLALQHSGLADAAQEIHLGINGTDADGLLLAAVAPDKAVLHVHGPNARWEFATLNHLRQWSQGHPGFAVFYHHSKAVTQPNDGHHHWHRRIMQKVLVDNWRQCVSDLEQGFEIVGRHFEPNLVHRPRNNPKFFVGNFWWSTSDYLGRLKALPEIGSHAQDRLLAEWWVASPLRELRIRDYWKKEHYTP